MNTKPVLEDDVVLLTPLLEVHFDRLYEVAKDPILWKYHPMNRGYEKDGFREFFNKALEIGSLLIVDKVTGKAIGCTRFYNYNEEDCSVVIGHTFYAKTYWGTGYNTRVKKLMLDYAFSFVEKIFFIVVKNNFRSRKAVEKLGATVSEEVKREYNNKSFDCVVYQISKINRYNKV